MDKVEFIKIESVDGSLVDYAIIDKGNGKFESMTKEHWDKLEAEREQSGTL